MKEKPNIILIAVDTLAARHMSCYGYERPTTPHMDRIADAGVRFSQMIAPNIPTTPAYTSMFTGLNAFSHRAVSLKNKAGKPDAGLPTLPQLFRENGYTTAAVSTLLELRPWFAKGFDYGMRSKGGRSAECMNARALPWLEKMAEQPFFMFLHCWDPHTPYQPPDDLKRRYYDGDEKDPDNHSLDPHKRQPVYPFYEQFHLSKYGGVTDADYISALYDAEVTSADRELGKLFAFLEESGLMDRTAVFLTADHGENMTEHGFYWCHQGTYEEVIAVPLIVWAPALFPAGKESDALVQHADFMPTFMEMAGLPPPRRTDGMSLVPLLNASADAGHDFVVLSECVWQARCGIRTREWKFMKTIDKGMFDLPPRELYHLKDDPKERHNLVEAHPALARDLELKMMRWIDERLAGRPNPLRLESAAGLDGQEMVNNVPAGKGVSWHSLTPGDVGRSRVRSS